MVEFDDGTFGVIDFKTGNLREEHPNLYGRQLHAYAYALENAAEGALALAPVTKMGLLYFHPQKTLQRDNEIDKLLYEAAIQWAEVDKNQDNFLTFVSEMLKTLMLPSPPLAGSNCAWCKYRQGMIELGRVVKAKGG